MGYASLHGKAWVVGKLLQLEPVPHVFLDIGAGAGSWLDSIKPWFIDSRWIAVEAWEPYIPRFELQSRYDLVLQNDVRETCLIESDVIIMGDVLEHMSEEEALQVWTKARDAARLACVLSLPIIEYPQGHVHGNKYQEHLSTWSHEKVMDVFPGIKASNVGDVVGTYVAL